MLEKSLESPLDCKEIQPVNPNGNQSWIFIRRTGAKAEVPIFWPSDAKNWLFGKDPDTGKDWRQEKGTTEDDMVGGITYMVNLGFSSLWELVMDREAWHAAVHGITKSRTRLSDWTELKWMWPSVSLIMLFVMPIVLLFSLSSLFAEPRDHKVRAMRLEGYWRSHLNYRHIYSLLGGTAAIAVSSLGWHTIPSSRHAVFFPLVVDPMDTATTQQ